MLDFIKRHHRFSFYTAWITLAVIQASFTEVQDDESYYWVYAHYLDWGYFDHPPMIALLIRAGAFLGHGPLALRFFPLIFNVLTLWLIELLIPRKDPFLFYAICLSLGVLHLAGFFAVPDIPLIFFTALTFLIYQKYLYYKSWTFAFLLGLVAACLFYSKYHGALVVFFILLSNLKLLRDKKMYLAATVSLALILPHLWWQYTHHWVTFQYQLIERSSDYNITYTTDYLIGQLLFAGPIAGVILLPATFLYRPKDILEKALRFSAVGFLIFFLLSSFKGRVEANWTGPALVSIIILSHNYLSDHFHWRKWLMRLLPFSLSLIFLVRVITIINILDLEPITERYFAWKNWPQQLSLQTRRQPVVFKNNYQRASKFWYYSGQLTFSLNNYTERQNNFNFWPIEDSLLGKQVVVMDIYNPDSYPHTIKTPMWTIGYGQDSSFYSFVKIEIEVRPLRNTIHQEDSLLLQTHSIIPTHYKNYLLQHRQVNPAIIIGALSNNHGAGDFSTGLSLQDFVENPNRQIKIKPSLPLGSYNLYFAIKSSTGSFTRNSERILLTVVEPQEKKKIS